MIPYIVQHVCVGLSIFDDLCYCNTQMPFKELAFTDISLSTVCCSVLGQDVLTGCNVMHQ